MSPNKCTHKAHELSRESADSSPDRGKMRKVPLAPGKQGSEAIPHSKNAEHAGNGENAAGFHVVGLYF